MKKTAAAGLALLIAGALVFCAGYVGARGDLSAVNGSVGPFRVHLTDGRLEGGFFERGPSGVSGIGGSRDGSVTAPPRRSADASGNSRDAEELSFDSDGVRRVEIKELCADVELLPSGDGRIHVAAGEPGEYDCTLSGGVLKIERKKRVNFVFGLDLSGGAVVRVELPEQLGCELEVVSELGGVTVSDLALGLVKLDADCGDVSVENISCAGAELSSDLGDVSARNVACSGELVAEADMGGVTVDGCAAAGALRAGSDCGAVSISGCTAADAGLTADMGDISADGLAAAGSVKIDCGCGSIEVRALSAGREIELQNDLGSISGVLAGSIRDYDIESGAGLGGSNLPPRLSMGETVLKVFTDCGSIDISFEED